MSDKPEKLVIISYRKDGKTYLLSMPSEHAEWAEEMLNLDREAVERKAAEKALTDLACKIEATSKRTDNTFTEHAVVEAGGLELLREAAEAYRGEKNE